MSEQWARLEGVSGIPERLEAAFRRRADLEARGILCQPDVFVVNPNSHYGCLAVTDGQGFVPTREEFARVVGMLEELYEHASDDEIREHNRSRRLELDEEERRWREPQGRPKPKRDPVPGFVYAMHVPGMNAVKIGLTRKNVAARAHQLWDATGFRHEPVWCQHFDDPAAMERALHKALDRHRIRKTGPFNEYFRLAGAA